MSTPSYDEIRQQVQRRYRRRSYFVLHLIMAVTGTAAIWMIDPTPQDGTPVIALLWAGLLVFHAVKAFVLDEAQDREVERMWRRYSGEFDDEKPKRSLHLTDDAEIEVIEEEAQERRYIRGV